MWHKNLAQGQIGESKIARWLRSRGNWVLPVYEKEINNHKGPRLFIPSGELIAPDMLVMGAESIQWIEAKHKEAFSWHRISRQWVTGIDVRHYEDYLQVNAFSPYPVWLLFLHEGGQAKDSPPNSPEGLFGQSLDYLQSHENHRSDKHANGMVYWRHGDLIKLASLAEVNQCSSDSVENIPARRLISQSRREQLRQQLMRLG